MTKKAVLVSLSLVFLVAMTALAGGHDKVTIKPETVTLQGEIVCAKCTAKVEGAGACENVLLVKKEDQKTIYWFTKNEVTESMAHVCQGSKKVEVTGQVAKKDGKHWITPTEMKPVETS